MLNLVYQLNVEITARKEQNNFTRITEYVVAGEASECLRGDTS